MAVGSAANGRRGLLKKQVAHVNMYPSDRVAPKGGFYIPSLDGIRAVSFFLVFFAHVGQGKLLVPAGFGVTIFFLLSGFLITTLLRLEYRRFDQISLKDFYLRRVLRILPPLYTTLALSMLLVTLGKVSTGIPIAGTLSQVLQYANYFRIYAGDSAAMPGTGVLWSLAVEEHFYLLFPLLYVWMCPRFTGTRQALVLLTLCVIAPAWRCVLYFHCHASFDRIYMATDTRFDSILWGSVLAVVANPILNDPIYELMLTHLRWLVAVSLAVLLATFLWRDEGFRATIRYTLQGLAMLPLLIAAIQFPDSLVVRILNFYWVRFLGVLSYSLYLCHSIILAAIMRTGATGKLFTGVAAMIYALIFATLVHYLIDRPFAAVRKRFSRVHST